MSCSGWERDCLCGMSALSVVRCIGIVISFIHLLVAQSGNLAFVTMVPRPGWAGYWVWKVGSKDGNLGGAAYFGRQYDWDAASKQMVLTYDDGASSAPSLKSVHDTDQSPAHPTKRRTQLWSKNRDLSEHSPHLFSITGSPHDSHSSCFFFPPHFLKPQFKQMCCSSNIYCHLFTKKHVAMCDMLKLCGAEVQYPISSCKTCQCFPQIYWMKFCRKLILLHKNISNVQSILT